MHHMNRRARRNLLRHVREVAPVAGDFSGAWKFWNELYNGSRRKPMFSAVKGKR